MKNVSIGTVFEWYPWISYSMLILTILVTAGIILLYRKEMESTIKRYITLLSILSLVASIWITEVVIYITGWLITITFPQRIISTIIVIAILLLDRETIEKFKNLVQGPQPENLDFNTTSLEDEFIFDDEFPSFEEIIST